MISIGRLQKMGCFFFTALDEKAYIVYIQLCVFYAQFTWFI